MMSTRELAFKYGRKLKPTVFDSGVAARLPEAYRKFYEEWRSPPAPVHYIPYTGKPWVRDPETGEVKRKIDVPLPLKHPKELHNVFTGGEAVVQGFEKRTRYGVRVPHFWVPRVYRSAIYSEILDKYLSALLTKRVIELIHKYQGLDMYLLDTKACDLSTLVALKLKRKLLEALQNRNLPYSEEKNQMIYEKYKKYMIPPEELEWYGLTISEAIIKQKAIEEAEAKAAIQPFKHAFRAQLIEEIKQGKLSQNTLPDEADEEKPKSWFQKIPGLSKLTKDS